MKKIIRASEESWQLYNEYSFCSREESEGSNSSEQNPSESIEPLRLVSPAIFHQRTFCSMHVVGALNSGNRFLEYFPPSCSKRQQTPLHAFTMKIRVEITRRRDRILFDLELSRFVIPLLISFHLNARFQTRPSPRNKTISRLRSTRSTMIDSNHL